MNSCGAQNRWSLLLVANDFDRYANSHSLPRPQDAVVFLSPLLLTQEGEASHYNYFIYNRLCPFNYEL